MTSAGAWTVKSTPVSPRPLAWPCPKIRAHGTGDIDHLDGLSVAYADWRFNLRRSSTEPLLRLNVETRGLMKNLGARAGASPYTIGQAYVETSVADRVRSR